MKKLMILTLALICALLLCACGCKHEVWLDADCVTPKTCESCGETEGSPLGHSWIVATCDTAKTCEVCGTVEGQPLGHSWADATCEAPKTCSACGLTEGEALGHQWQEATTEAPKTCSVCAATEGERIITDPRFTTAACAPIFGQWQGTVDIPVEALGLDLGDYAESISVSVTLDFHNDGSAGITVGAADMDAFKQLMLDYAVDVMYQEFTSMGLSKEEADAAMQEVYGMSIEEYLTAELEKLDVDSLFAEFNNMGYVYYVEDGQIYLGEGWDDDMEPQDFTLEGDVLSLLMEDIDPFVFNRIGD